MDKTPIKAVLESEVDRKQFLQRIGAGAIVVLGASRIIESLSPRTPKRTSGYGSGDYSNQ